jgi:hypothetical protein
MMEEEEEITRYPSHVLAQTRFRDSFASIPRPVTREALSRQWPRERFRKRRQSAPRDLD